MAEKATAAKPAKEGLDKALKHHGTFFNWRKQEHAGYLVWDEEKRGFVAKCAKTHRLFKPFAVKDVAEFLAHNVRFELSGKNEPLKEAK